MAYKDRGLPIPYVVGMPPLGQDVETLTRAAWEELQRIQQSLTDLDKPNTLSVRGTESLNVTTAPSFQRLLNSGAVIDYANPAGVFDVLTGVYTCPQEGIYQVVAVLDVPVFPTPAVKEYYAGLRVTVTPAVGPPRVRIAYDGGQDNVPKSALMITLVSLLKGDLIHVDGTAVHQTIAGAVSVGTSLQIVRLSAA